MKTIKINLILLVLFAVGGVVFAGGVKELALDDTWSVSSIESEDVIRKNLDEWIQVMFDSNSDTVRISTGSAWPDVLQGIDGVFTYKWGKNNSTMYLLQEGETVYTITIEISKNLREMTWTGLKRGKITFVGRDGPIQRVTFSRN